VSRQNFLLTAKHQFLTAKHQFLTAKHQFLTAKHQFLTAKLQFLTAKLQFLTAKLFKNFKLNLYFHAITPHARSTRRNESCGHRMAIVDMS
jgi:hypothetical protein